MPGLGTSDIGVIGSPSTSLELTVDLLQEACEERLVGALVSFKATQDGRQINSVGQLVSIELRNRWHEDATFRNLLKRTGEIPPITNRQDTRTAQLAVGATFQDAGKGWDPCLLGMVPSTGTRVGRVDQQQLDLLLKVYQEELFYLGRAYANDVLYPMWFKHFGSGERGAGEAYHGGVFGRTGSGKSGLAKMLLVAYARHPEMGVLVIDPQGEFSLELNGTMVGHQRLPLQGLLEGMGRKTQVYRIRDIQLEEWDLLEELLVAMNFTEQLGIPNASSDNSRKAAEMIVRALRGKRRLHELTNRESLREALEFLTIEKNAEYVYSTKSRCSQLVEKIMDLIDNELDDLLQRSWVPIVSLFQAGDNKRKLYGIVADLIGQAGTNTERSIVSIDLSEQGNRRDGVWSENLQKRLIKRLLDSLVANASRTLGTQKGANVLVLLDEAARLAPSGRLDPGSEAEQLRTTLRHAVRETRKYGIGWFFVSQTLGGLDGETLQQLRILIFGFGLALGDEFRKLGEFAGGDGRAMELYQSFRDPHSAPRPDLREFPFMAVGPVSPLSFSGRPVFFSAFTDAEEFTAANSLQTKLSKGAP